MRKIAKKISKIKQTCIFSSIHTSHLPFCASHSKFSHFLSRNNCEKTIRQKSDQNRERHLISKSILGILDTEKWYFLGRFSNFGQRKGDLGISEIAESKTRLEKSSVEFSAEPFHFVRIQRWRCCCCCNSNRQQNSVTHARTLPPPANRTGVIHYLADRRRTAEERAQPLPPTNLPFTRQERECTLLLLRASGRVLGWKEGHLAIRLRSRTTILKKNQQFW